MNCSIYCHGNVSERFFSALQLCARILVGFVYLIHKVFMAFAFNERK